MFVVLTFEAGLELAHYLYANHVHFMRTSYRSKPEPVKCCLLMPYRESASRMLNVGLFCREKDLQKLLTCFPRSKSTKKHAFCVHILH